MQIINDSFHGFRQFAAGIIAHGKTLGEWVSCRDLQASRLGLSVTIGGDNIKVVDGSDLLRELITAAKAGKLSKDEAEAIASQLDLISVKFDHRRCVYFCEVVVTDFILEPSAEIIPSDVLTDVPADVSIEADVVVQSEQPTEGLDSPVEQAEAPKRGRKAAK